MLWKEPIYYGLGLPSNTLTLTFFLLTQVRGFNGWWFMSVFVNCFWLTPGVQSNHLERERMNIEGQVSKYVLTENFFMRFVRIDTVSYQLNMHKFRDEAGVLS